MNIIKFFENIINPSIYTINGYCVREVSAKDKVQFAQYRFEKSKSNLLYFEEDPFSLRIDKIVAQSNQDFDELLKSFESLAHFLGKNRLRYQDTIDDCTCERLLKYGFYEGEKDYGNNRHFFFNLK